MGNPPLSVRVKPTTLLLSLVAIGSKIIDEFFIKTNTKNLNKNIVMLSIIHKN